MITLACTYAISLAAMSVLIYSNELSFCSFLVLVDGVSFPCVITLLFFIFGWREIMGMGYGGSGDCRLIKIVWFMNSFISQKLLITTSSDIDLHFKSEHLVSY